ncbi:MAG: Smr/MutS family protein [Deltaproteobacteria bacterium]|nr:Smr/MutS family protein [Deltaproteobacteria bacterium]
MKKPGNKDVFNPVLKDADLKLGPSPKEPLPPVAGDAPDPAPERDPASDETRAFLEAVADVKPLPGRRKKNPRPASASPGPAHPAPDETREALDHLERLVRGSVEMDISFTDEYMEGAVKGVERKVMRRLKQGRFPIQDHLDLHGLTSGEARNRVREFLLECRKLGLRCVLIIHGRGLNSPSSLPVLKEQLPSWFSSGSVRKIVLAFATARPYDGGAGAVYVLLRGR